VELLHPLAIIEAIRLEWGGAQSVIKPSFESPVRLPRGAENIGTSLYYQQLTL
jgi:hypothetical protein